MPTLLILNPPITTIVTYANSLDLDEMPSNSASQPDPSSLTLRQHLYKTMKIEADEKFKRRQFNWRAKG